MKTLGAKMIGLLVAAFILCSAFRADKPVVTVFMIGDSTMANKKLDGGNPERGWGMVLPGFFSEDIRIDNHAANGRSSRSFISEGRWEKVISKVIPGQNKTNEEFQSLWRRTSCSNRFSDDECKGISNSRYDTCNGTCNAAKSSMGNICDAFCFLRTIFLLCRRKGTDIIKM